MPLAELLYAVWGVEFCRQSVALLARKPMLSTA